MNIQRTPFFASKRATGNKGKKNSVITVEDSRTGRLVCQDDSLSILNPEETKEKKKRRKNGVVMTNTKTGVTHYNLTIFFLQPPAKVDSSGTSRPQDTMTVQAMTGDELLRMLVQQTHRPKKTIQKILKLEPNRVLTPLEIMQALEKLQTKRR